VKKIDDDSSGFLIRSRSVVYSTEVWRRMPEPPTLLLEGCVFGDLINTIHDMKWKFPICSTTFEDLTSDATQSPHKKLLTLKKSTILSSGGTSLFWVSTCIWTKETCWNSNTVTTIMCKETKSPSIEVTVRVEVSIIRIVCPSWL
jgi:hypothetical protein